MKKCPSCGEVLGNGVTKCFKCGATMPRSDEYQKICPHCGIVYSSRATECENCHGPLSVYSNIASAGVAQTESNERWPYIVSFLFPYIGIILGIIFIAQKRENGPKVLGISLITLVVCAIIVNLFFLH